MKKNARTSSLAVYRQKVYDVAADMMSAAANGALDNDTVHEFIGCLVALADEPIDESVKVYCGGRRSLEARVRGDRIVIVTRDDDSVLEAAEFRYDGGVVKAEVVNGDDIVDLEHIPMGKASAKLVETLAGVGDDTLLFYRHYQYARQNYTLMFVQLTLTDAQVLRLLEWFNSAYGDTAQETTDYALEFEILSRNLLNDHALLVNPLYLDADEDYLCDSGLCDILGPANVEKYKKYYGISQNEVRLLAMKK